MTLKQAFTMWARAPRNTVLAAKSRDAVRRASAAQQALAVFSDDELLDELDRRGWQGDLRRTQVVTIGAKED